MKCGVMSCPVVKMMCVIVIFGFLYIALADIVNQFMYFIGPTVKNHTWLHAILWSLIKVKLAMS